MRVFRVLLALILAVGPVQAQPVVDLLTRYTVPADETAASAPEGDAPPGSGKRLAELEANLALIGEGLESFAHPTDADKALLAAKSRLPAGAAPFFRDRAQALDSLYRTLTVVDYTWALRFPDPPCAPAARRAALLRSDDGLFLDPISGKISSWMAGLLGPNASGKSLESALDQVSASSPPSRAEYARLRARQNLITKALEAKDAVGEARAVLYCKRAETRLKLAAANSTSGPVLAARSTEEAVSRRGLVILAGKTDAVLEVRGAGIVVGTKAGLRVLTDHRLGSGEVVALVDGIAAPVPLSVERENERAGLLLLRPDGDLGDSLTLAELAPRENELVFALAHSDRLGAWTKTQGLVTSAGPDQFSTDAVADASMTGGAVLDEEGRVAGLLVLRRTKEGPQEWPVAVPAPALRAWLDGGAAPQAEATENLADAGTTKILTVSRPLLVSLAAPGKDAISASYGPIYTQTPWGTVRGVCAANCEDSSPGSNYSSGGNANKELGEALGKLAVVGLEALIFRGIPALFRKIGSTFSKSKSSPSVSPRRPEVREIPRETPKPKEPPALIGLTLEVSPMTAAPGEKVTLTARANLNDATASKAGIAVDFKAMPPTLVSFSGEPQSKTDISGVATITATLRRDHGVRTVKAGDLKAVKGKSDSAQSELDAEIRAMSGEESGQAISDVEMRVDEKIEFEARATVGKSLSALRSVTLSNGPAKPTCRFEPVSIPESVGEEPFTVGMRLSCTKVEGHAEVNLEGHEISLSIEREGGNPQLTVMLHTDVNGYASAIFQVSDDAQSLPATSIGPGSDPHFINAANPGPAVLEPVEKAIENPTIRKIVISGAAAAPIPIVGKIFLIGTAGVYASHTTFKVWVDWKAAKDQKKYEQGQEDSRNARQAPKEPDCKNYRELNRNVGLSCKKFPRTCQEGDMTPEGCDEIRIRILRNKDCIAARRRLMVECFGGGDPRHEREVARELIVLDHCEKRLIKECQ